jgi:hypothetical protein
LSDKIKLFFKGHEVNAFQDKPNAKRSKVSSYGMIKVYNKFMQAGKTTGPHYLGNTKKLQALGIRPSA